ncbi:MAG: flagellar export protein FliJ [Woeseiaceae bacterium]
MKNRVKKLDKIVSLTKSEEQRLGGEIARSRSVYDDHMARLGELNAYRQNYLERSRTLTKATSAHWKDYQSFMHRLDNAVSSQQQIVKDSEMNLEKHRQRWHAKRQRLDSLQRVRDSYRSEEEAHRERLLQRSIDDMPPRPDMYSDKEEDD